MTQIASLRRPPEGYVWLNDPDREANRKRLASRQSQYHQERDPRLYPGPRPDAMSTANLPSLTPGISTLPASCQHCGSALLNVEAPLGEHQRGLISCGTCGRQICWLTPRITTRRGPEPATPAPSPVRPAIHARLERLLGCGRACSIVYGHDPLTHEAFGRQQARSERESAPQGVVKTGPLTVDFGASLILLDGHNAGLTPTEIKIVERLAERAGQLCPYEDVVSRVWGDSLGWVWSEAMRVLRTNMGRIRARLGAAGSLIETRVGRGYVLRLEPPRGEHACQCSVGLSAPAREAAR